MVESSNVLKPIALPEREAFYHVDSIGWTPEKVRSALVAAESGSLMAIADLVETMLSDDRIDGVLSTRTHGLLGLPLHFKGGSAQAQSELNSGTWDFLHSESDLVRLLSWGIVLGIGVAQRIPIPRTIGQPQKYRMEVWSPRWLRWDYNYNTWVIQTTDGPEFVDSDKWILFTPYGEHRPWSGGKWRSLVFPWLLKRFALEDRANYSETAGQPVKVGESPEGSTENQRIDFQNQLANLGRNGAITLPEGWDFKIVEASSTNWQIYSESVKWADDAITIVLAGQTVTTEGSSGFSSGNVQDRIKIDFIRFDAKSLSNCLYKQSLIPWAIANYGSELDAPMPHWVVEKQTDLSLQASTFETLARAISGLDQAIKSSLYKVDAAELANIYGIPLVALPPDQPDQSIPDLGLAPTDIARTITINEARAAKGLGPLRLPDGSLDPRGDSMITEADVDYAPRVDAVTNGNPRE